MACVLVLAKLDMQNILAIYAVQDNFQWRGVKQVAMS